MVTATRAAVNAVSSGIAVQYPIRYDTMRCDAAAASTDFYIIVHTTTMSNSTLSTLLDSNEVQLRRYAT